MTDSEKTDNQEEVLEVTWKDDENRVTLALRSIFVLLCGVVILWSFRMPSQSLPLLVDTFIISIAIPVFVIWLFFGQGLRPVEWLSDQRYNAWNYGLYFKDYKSHLKAATVLIVLAIVVMGAPSLFTPHSQKWIDLSDFLLFLPALLITTWYLLMAICVVWFFWGFLWFGMAQGFGDWAATVLVSAFIITFLITWDDGIRLIYSPHIIHTISFLIVLLSFGYCCHKYRSFAPVLYAVLILILIFLGSPFLGSTLPHA